MIQGLDIQPNKASITNPEYNRAKAEAIVLKLNNPNLSVRDIAEKTGISKTTVADIIKEELTDKGDQNFKIVDNAKKFILKYQGKLLASDLNVENASDLLQISSAMKNQQSLVSMIEGYQGQGDKNIIPVNIQVNIDSKKD